MARATQSIADQLRAAIREAERRGVTRYRIAKESGVSQATLSLFLMDRKRDLRTSMAEKIARAIGARLVLTPRG